MVTLSTQTKYHAALIDVSTPHVAADIPASWEKVSLTTVSGGAVQSVAFTNLNLTAAMEYVIEFYIANPAAGSASLSIRFNSDATATNYYRQRLYVKGLLASAEYANDNEIGPSLYAGEQAQGCVRIMQMSGNKARWLASGNERAAADMSFRHSAGEWATLANVTRIDIVSDVAASIGNGSYFILWKVSK